ncbi:hypothetical protein C5E04_18790 [Pectobacterium parmentieri]|uniref:hypothetical protein n=1 Tax=Pectobacterium parmentieri TaxID=1905730 RepID=UPI000EB40725|nr:hypothetical protein [Pectobacterium parmentieri]RKO74368.1 hypothetical protein C5E04_18790 [Pectobacterium parmentieri]
MQLTEFIDKHFNGNKAAFARHMKVDAQAVNKWIKSEWFVSTNDDNKIRLSSVRREIPPLP